MISSALIVDDAFDEAPAPSEVGDWSNFVDDLAIDEVQFLQENFSQLIADEGIAGAVNNSDFCTFVWVQKDRFNPTRWDEVFGDYERLRNRDLIFLAELEAQLKKLSVPFEKCGRIISDNANSVDLIVVDLFLGSKQSTTDYRLTIDKISEVVKERLEKPPIVILMSNSDRLEALREKFREETGLFSSCFRIIEKTTLKNDPSAFPALVRRLSGSYENVLKISQFHVSWEKSAREALVATSKKMRAMELHDYAQIRQLVLDAEEEPIGNYILDLFDRLLVFDVEEDPAVVAAALELNSVDLGCLKAPYLHGQNCFIELDYKISFMNSSRLQLNKGKLRFGDLFRLGEGGDRSRNSLKIQLKPKPQSVFLIISPACELQRNSKENVLLLRGELVVLDGAEFKYKSKAHNVTMFCNDSQKYRIDWEVKSIDSVRREALERCLFEAKIFEVIGRLRESNALDLRHHALSSFGRVGLMPSLPRRSLLHAEFYIVNLDGNLELLPISPVEGACLNGRNQRGNFAKFYLDEVGCAQVVNAYQSKSSEINLRVNSSAKWFDDQEIVEAFSDGLPISPEEENLWKPMSLEIKGIKRKIGFVLRGQIDTSAEFHKNDIKVAGLLMRLY